MRTYRGKCHCGAVAFEIDSDPITTAIRCNCSICRRKGAVMSSEYFPPERFRLTAKSDALRIYIFGDREVNHYFCATCGVYPFHDAINAPSKGHRVNLGCIDELDLDALQVRRFDGADSWTFFD